MLRNAADIGERSPKRPDSASLDLVWFYLKCPLFPTKNDFILENNQKAIHQVLKTEALLYVQFLYISPLRMNKKMNSRSSTLTLIGTTSTSSANNPPSHKSDMIKARNYADMVAGNGLPPPPFLLPGLRSPLSHHEPTRSPRQLPHPISVSFSNI